MSLVNAVLIVHLYSNPWERCLQASRLISQRCVKTRYFVHLGTAYEECSSCLRRSIERTLKEAMEETGCMS